MTAIRADVIGADVFALMLERAPAEIEAKTSLAVRHHGQMLLTRIRRNASGRPGPNAITGDYRRSWTMRMGMIAGLTTAWVGTNAPQGRRLEFGFHGQDSLGRHYDQQPYPHVGPAMEQTIEEFQNSIYAIVEEVFS